MILLTEAGGCEFLKILPELHSMQFGMKIIVKPSGCHHDDLTTGAMVKADLVITSEHSPQQIIKEIRTLFQVDAERKS